ncbi:MAG TPA: hypothetical protein VKT30_12420 [Caulobacteraceae bacterium]|nr:hypothetical protein [Caulobacteraceae bacterium]
MGAKHPKPARWGGPGASHEDRTKPAPDRTVKDADDPDRGTRHSQVSGGGGESDVHHAHESEKKHRFRAGRDEKGVKHA